MPAEIPSNRSQVSPSDGPPDVQARLNATLEQLDSRQDGWAQAVRQDAVEAVVRLGWMQKVRAGVRVPASKLGAEPATTMAALSTIGVLLDFVGPTLHTLPNDGWYSAIFKEL